MSKKQDSRSSLIRLMRFDCRCRNSVARRYRGAHICDRCWTRLKPVAPSGSISPGRYVHVLRLDLVGG